MNGDTQAPHLGQVFVTATIQGVVLILAEPEPEFAVIGTDVGLILQTGISNEPEITRFLVREHAAGPETLVAVLHGNVQVFHSQGLNTAGIAVQVSDNLFSTGTDIAPGR
jgi:hypothetical protein